MSTFVASFVYFFLLISFFSNLHQSAADNKHNAGDFNSSSVLAHSSSHRKLLLQESCTKRDICISQSYIGLSRGIPQFAVEIVNECLSGCPPRHIHFHCGWFASARVVPPKIFKRLSYDDCLVNHGAALHPRQVIRFMYSNSFNYTISFKHAQFC